MGESVGSESDDGDDDDGQMELLMKQLAKLKADKAKKRAAKAEARKKKTYQELEDVLNHAAEAFITQREDEERGRKQINKELASRVKKCWEDQQHSQQGFLRSLTIMLKQHKGHMKNLNKAIKSCIRNEDDVNQRVKGTMEQLESESVKVMTALSSELIAPASPLPPTLLLGQPRTFSLKNQSP